MGVQCDVAVEVAVGVEGDVVVGVVNVEGVAAFIIFYVFIIILFIYLITINK